MTCKTKQDVSFFFNVSSYHIKNINPYKDSLVLCDTIRCCYTCGFIALQIQRNHSPRVRIPTLRTIKEHQQKCASTY